MKVGLIDVDGHHFPNLALMKISAYHKRRGDHVEWCMPLDRYDLVYQAKVFNETYSKDIDWTPQADQVLKGGTGYNLTERLPEEIERQYPDYGLYPQYEEAYGFLTRGCPRGCGFCIVSEKEGRKSEQVADLGEFWRGQKEIKLLDPNLLACREREKLLMQLIESGAKVDFTQGLDIRLVDTDIAGLLERIRIKAIHFAWDNPGDRETERKLQWFSEQTTLGRKRRVVYILTNFNSTHEEDLERVRRVWEMGYTPYVMIYDKPNAPRITRHLQRWCNRHIIYVVPRFEDYMPQKLEGSGEW